MKRISTRLTAQIETRLGQKTMTGVQVYFLVYILRHHPKGTYLTELYREIGISKSTLSALIKKMEEKEYLYIHTDSEDIRKKKVLPTAKLIGEGDQLLREVDQMESELFSGLNPQEKKQLCFMTGASFVTLHSLTLSTSVCTYQVTQTDLHRRRQS